MDLTFTPLEEISHLLYTQGFWDMSWHLRLSRVDPGERNLKPGDRVTVEPYIGCGRCYPCSRGRYNCCEDLEVLGVHRDGGFQEYITIPREKVYKAPETMDVEELALIESFHEPSYKTRIYI